MRTRCRDKNGDSIWEGDVVSVEEYPDKYVGGSLSFEGVVTLEKGGARITYFDIGEEESFPLSFFPVAGREILTDEESRGYWRTALLGGEPPEELWKKEKYRVRKIADSSKI